MSTSTAKVGRKRDVPLMVLLSPSEKTSLQKLAEHLDMPVSMVVRQLLKRATAEKSAED